MKLYVILVNDDCVLDEAVFKSILEAKLYLEDSAEFDIYDNDIQICELKPICVAEVTKVKVNWKKHGRK